MMDHVLVVVSLPPGMPFGGRRVVAIESDRAGFTASADLTRDDIAQALTTASRLVARMKRINGKRPIAPLPPAPAGVGVGPPSPTSTRVGVPA
jgi:hypothetical protein